MAVKMSSKKKMDEKLNFLSPKFDPLKAIYSSDLQPPVPNIHTFNNLAEYAKAIKEGKIKSSEFVKTTKPQASRTRNLKPEYKLTEENDLQERLKAISECKASKIERRKSEQKGEGRMDDEKLQEFILAEEAFKAERTKKKRLTVIQRMEACTEGPFSVLHTCLTERRRVKVWTRRYKGLRSVLAGYLVAFDKHMNLALFDVDEVYTLEERIEHDEDNGESLGARAKKEKKKKRAKFPVQRKPPPEDTNDETIVKSPSTSKSPTEEVNYTENSSDCEEEMGKIEFDGSSSHNSFDGEVITNNPSRKEIAEAPLQGSSSKGVTFIDCHTTVSNPNMDITEDQSLMPSAKALSTALQTPGLCVGQVDDITLKVTTQRTDAVLDRATESETLQSARGNDYIEDTSEGTIQPVAANVEGFNGGRINNTRQWDNFADENENNPGKNPSSETTEQEARLFDSKPDLPEVNMTCGYTENVELTVNLDQTKNTTDETLLHREKKEGSLDTCLEHATMKNERTTSQQISHTEIISHSHATEPLKVTSENVDQRVNWCENTQPFETTYSVTAGHPGNESVEMPETERSYRSKTSDGLCHDENSLVQSQETTQEFSCTDDRALDEGCLNSVELRITSNSREDNSTIDVSPHTYLAANSLSLPLVCTEEDLPLSPEASTVSLELDSGITVCNVQSGMGECASSGSNKADVVCHDKPEHAFVGTPQVSTLDTNNSCGSAVCLESTDSVLDDRTNGCDGESNQKIEAVSVDTQCCGMGENSTKALSYNEEDTVSGDFVSCCQEERESQRFCSLNSEQQNNELSSSLKEQPRNVKESTDDHEVGLQQSRQAENQFSKVQDTYSDPKKLEKLENPPADTLPFEDHGTSGDKIGDMTTTENKTESSGYSLVNPTEKVIEVKNEPGNLDSLQSDSNCNSEELTVKEDEETPSIKRAEGVCSIMKPNGQTKGEMADNRTLNTVGESTQWAGEDEKEEGEISSDGDENTLADGKTQREEKEEGELSSSDSDAETLINTSLVQLAATSFKVFQGQSILKMKEEEVLAPRRHSSSDLSHKITRERQNSKRRASSSFLQDNDLRTKLCEAQKKKMSLKIKTAHSRETKHFGGPASQPQFVETAMNTNVTAEKHSDRLRHVKGHTKERRTKLQQTSQVKRSKTQKRIRESGCKNTSNDEKEGNTSHSVRRTTRKPIGSSQGQDKKTNEKDQQRQKIEDRPGKSRRSAKKMVNKPTAIRETGDKKVPKARTPQECKENTTKAKPDNLAVRKETKKHATIRSKGKTSAKSNAEKSSPAAINKPKDKTTAGHDSNKSVTPYSQNAGTQTTANSGSFLTQSLKSGSKHDKDNKQCSVALQMVHGKEQSKRGKTSGVRDAKSNIGDLNGKRKTIQSKTAHKVSPRTETRNILKKSTASVASRAKTKLQCRNETRQENPRKRRRSVDSTDTKQAKKLRLREKIDSSSKLASGSSKTEMPKMSKRSSQCNIIKENKPPSSEMGNSENKMAPVRDEQMIKSTAEYKCVDDSMKKSSEIDSIQTKPVLIGPNKCLVFKRRHVNQLFIRGDNVVMIAYTK